MWYAQTFGHDSMYNYIIYLHSSQSTIFLSKRLSVLKIQARSHQDTINPNQRDLPSAFCPCLHRFFWADADALLPKMNEEVCLSAPVFFETRDDPANMICSQQRVNSDNIFETSGD
jgi:hypothetical protein